VDDVILATTTDGKDDVLASWADSEGVEFHRGSEEDVLLRVIEAQRKMKAEVVVEICGDMTLLDPEVVDLGVKAFLESECHVVTTTCKPSYPVGVDAVVFRLRDLEWISENVGEPQFREHVSLYFFKHPEKYRILHLSAPKRLEAPHLRFVLDYPEDLEFIRAVYARLEPVYGDRFGLREIVDLLEKEPGLVEINRCYQETGGA
jgi:spore coat polysaccharide biosynthesis protein SpsF